MKSIIMLLINGNTFRFEDDGFTASQKASMENVAQNIFIEQPWLKDDIKQGLINANELCSWFVNEVNKRFKIKLKSIDISFIVRIHGSSLF